MDFTDHSDVVHLFFKNTFENNQTILDWVGTIHLFTTLFIEKRNVSFILFI
jgi:hypothetical protein